METMTKRCNRVVNQLKPEIKDWGFCFTVPAELDALRIAYAYRHAPNGVKVEEIRNGYLVTVWNDGAKAMGCDV